MARIGIFTRPIDQRFSGSGFHLERLLLAVADEEQPHELILLHHEESDSPVYSGGRFNDVIVPRNVVGAARAVRRLELDLVHHNPLSIKIPVVGHSARQVATVHSAEPLLIPESYGLARRLHYRFFVLNAVRFMDGLITVSETSARYIASAAGISKDRFHVIYNAADQAFDAGKVPSQRRTELRRRYGLDRSFALHVSRYSPRKNPEVLLKAFRDLTLRTERPLYLVIAGTGWDNDEVRGLLDEYGLQGDVRLLGFTPTPALADLYRMALLFLNASRAEGFGMPNLEAMQSGCPVVTTGVFAIPEIVGDAALVVDDPDSPDDISAAAAEVLADDELRAELERRGRQRAKDFSWRTGARKLLSVYDEVLSG